MKPSLFLIGVTFFEFVHCYVEKQSYNENILVQRPLGETDVEYDEIDKILQSTVNAEETSVVNKYKPEWSDLDKRPLPGWYDKAKIGIFLHWGVFSVPSFHSEWFWYYWRHENDKECVSFMNKNYPPNFSYQEFAPMFKAEFFDPKKFADLFVKAGAKYVVLTSKHHEGFTLFPSKRSYSWNSVDVGPRRDLVGDLATAVRAAGLKFGVYHSLYEWFNPIYLADKQNNFSTQNYVLDKVWPDIKQLVNDYKPSVLWSDGDWETTDKYWKSTELLAWLYNESPVKDEIVVNDRWGQNIPCHHGDFYNCADRYNPGELQHHKWENAFTLDRHSWGYNRMMNLSHVLTMKELLKEVVSTVSCGGNALINIGPTKEGTIAPIFEERLLELGEWLSLNGEAIYSTSPWSHQNDSYNGNIWYTMKDPKYGPVYAIFLEWPKGNTLELGDIKSLYDNAWKVDMLGWKAGELQWKPAPGKKNIIRVSLPDQTLLASKYAWTLKFTPPHK